MEIVWFGLGCLRLTERGFPSVLTDPFDESEVGLRLPRLRTPIVTLSRPVEEPHELQWPAWLDVQRTIAGPGEYEIGGVFITGVMSLGLPHGTGLSADNIIYTINYDGLSVCHLGHLAQTPTQKLVEIIGRVDVLLVPVGVPGGLAGSKISETVSLIEPDIVVPIQYQTPGLKVDRLPVDAFVKEMGVTDSTAVENLKVISGTKPEETQIVLLKSHR